MISSAGRDTARHTAVIATRDRKTVALCGAGSHAGASIDHAQDPSHDDLPLRQPVTLLPHRLMLRPRESRDVRLISSTLTLTPTATVTWAQDVSGNAVATATFAGMAQSLLIDSVAEIQLNAVAWPVFDIVGSAIFYPFRYSDDEWSDLGALATQQYPDGDWCLRDWARGFVRSNPTDTLSLLKDLCAGVAERISYQSREVEETSRRRDIAARLGLLPRFCSPLR